MHRIHKKDNRNPPASPVKDRGPGQTQTAGIILITLLALLLTAALFCGAAAAYTTSAQFQTALDKGGIVKLQADVYDAKVTVTNEVTLDLNGYNVCGDTGPIFTIEKTGKLTVIDTAGLGDIVGGFCGKNGGAVYNQGTFIMKSGSISRCSTTLKGGAVYNEGTFIMEGGSISDCYCERYSGTGSVYGGGIYNKGTFTMKGGIISDCRVNTYISAGGCYGGGIYNAGKFTMTGGQIIRCSVEENPGTTGNYGGGVCNYGTFTMTGGTIAECTAGPCDNSNVYGGGVYNKATFTMKAGTIRECTTDRYGGGVCNEQNFTMSGGKITACSGLEGGGVYNEMNFTMSGGAISGCEADSDGGGVFNNTVFTMKGGTISGCSAEEGGGVENFFENSGIFTMTGGIITGCTAVRNGAGVDNCKIMKISGKAVISGNKLNSTENNVSLSFEDATLAQTGNFTGTVGINQGTSPANGKKFGTVTAGLTGAEHFFYDGRKFVGSVSGTKLVWKTPSAVTGVTVTGSTVVAKGKSIQLTAKASPADANQNFTWKSGKTSVATVTAAGKVTGKAIGTATITAVSRGGGSNASKTYTIEVKPATTSITVSGSTVVAKGKSIQLTAKASPAEANQSFTWTSSDAAVAAVSSTGKVTGKSLGTVTITAKAKDGTGISKTFSVTVKPATTAIKVSGSAGVAKGRSIQLKATASPSSAYQTFTWTSSDKTIASVTSTGKVTGVKTGTVKIYAKAKDGSGIKSTAFSVTVYANPVSSITLNSTAKSLKKGATFTLKPTIAPTTSRYGGISWTSDNKAVATVDSKGVVTAKAKGTAVITAKAKDGSGKYAKCKITVTA